MTTGPRTPEVTQDTNHVVEARDAILAFAGEYRNQTGMTYNQIIEALHLVTEGLSADKSEPDPKEVLRESIKAVIAAGKRAIAAGEGTRFGLELVSLGEDVMHRDDAQRGIHRTGHNVFAVMSDNIK